MMAFNFLKDKIRTDESLHVYYDVVITTMVAFIDSRKTCEYNLNNNT